MVTFLFAACGSRADKENDDTLTSRFNNTMNIHESIERDADGTISYKAVAWGGLIGTVKEHNLPVDWSDYEALTVEFSEPTKVATQLLVCDRYKAFGKPGISSLTYNFDGQDMTSIDEVTLQAAEATVLKVKDVRLVPVKGLWRKVPLRSLDVQFGDWQEGFVLAPELFANARKNDKLEFVYTTDTSRPEIGDCLLKTIIGGTDKTLEGNANALNKWGCAPVGRRSTIYRIPLTAGDVANLKKSGVFVNGRYLNISQCNLLQEDMSASADDMDEPADKNQD